MIAFLTLCYVAVLFILVKVKIIKLNLWWKISPLVWLVFLFFVLFLPMQWGAPGGTVNIYQYVVEIVPNVTGRVTEVPVRPLEPLKEGDVLFKIEPRPFQARVNKLEASLKLASENLKRAKELFAKRLGAEVEVDKYTAEVDKLKADLDDAKYDLESTEVRAPGDGYVVGLTLRPGQRVTNMPVRSFMSFVVMDRSKVIIGINQNTARNLRLGQSAEVTFKVLPGRIFNAKVVSGVPITPQGQLTPSGNVPLAPTANNVPQPFAVILELDEEIFEGVGLEELNIGSTPGGAFGSGAVYTESVKATHIIRKVMLRMDAWLNYLIPY